MLPNEQPADRKILISAPTNGLSELRMAESKSDEYVSKINEPSEFSSSVRPLMALGNSLRSECRLSCTAIGPGLLIISRCNPLRFTVLV
jgi:hypothetical protein